MPDRRIVVAAGAIALAAAIGSFALLQHYGGPVRAISTAAAIGGPFTLTAHDGQRLSDRDLLGKPFAVFFGFTYCPDVCPTSMLELSNVIAKLGPAADEIRFLFISVDSERDTPEHLKTYLSSFDRRILGLTGTAAEIAAVARAYRAYYEKVPTKDSFTYNHSALTYLMGRDGKYVTHIGYQEPEERQITKLKELIARR